MIEVRQPPAAATGMQLLTLVLILIASVASPSSAEVIEVPVPGLLGDHVLNCPRTATVDLGAAPASIDTVWIRWSGEMITGLGHGDGEEGPAEEWGDWGAEMAAAFDADPEPGWWLAVCRTQEGWFSETARFGSFPPHPSWGFFLDGRAEIEVQLYPQFGIGGVMVEPPFAVLTEAVLILRLDWSDPVEPGTWTSIKGMFR